MSLFLYKLWVLYVVVGFVIQFGFPLLMLIAKSIPFRRRSGDRLDAR